MNDKFSNQFIDLVSAAGTASTLWNDFHTSTDAETLYRAAIRDVQPTTLRAHIGSTNRYVEFIRDIHPTDFDPSSPTIQQFAELLLATDRGDICNRGRRRPSTKTIILGVRFFAQRAGVQTLITIVEQHTITNWVCHTDPWSRREAFPWPLLFLV